MDTTSIVLWSVCAGHCLVLVLASVYDQRQDTAARTARANRKIADEAAEREDRRRIVEALEKLAANLVVEQVEEEQGEREPQELSSFNPFRDPDARVRGSGQELNRGE